MIDALVGKIAALPTGPGCYVYKNAAGIEIYVGKAKNLRRRVASYFQERDGHPARTLRLVQEIADVQRSKPTAKWKRCCWRTS